MGAGEPLICVKHARLVFQLMAERQVELTASATALGLNSAYCPAFQFCSQMLLVPCRGWSMVKQLGPQVCMVVPDARTERTKHQVRPQAAHHGMHTQAAHHDMLEFWLSLALWHSHADSLHSQNGAPAAAWSLSQAGVPTSTCRC